MTNTLLTEGLIIMLIGVTFVMSFLCVMVFSMSIMSKVVGYLNKIFPEEIKNIEKTAKSVLSDDEALAVALAVAKVRG